MRIWCASIGRCPRRRDKVWAVLTDFTRLPGWYGDGMLEGKVGGAVRLMGSHIRGTVTQWQPPRKLAYSWNVFGSNDETSPYPESYLTLELSPQDSGTMLTLTHLPVLERFVKAERHGLAHLSRHGGGRRHRRAGRAARGLCQAQRRTLRRRSDEPAGR